jgi:hypothetical protein
MDPDELDALIAHCLDGMPPGHGAAIGMLTSGRLVLAFRDDGTGRPTGVLMSPFQLQMLMGMLDDAEQRCHAMNATTTIIGAAQ